MTAAAVRLQLALLALVPLAACGGTTPPVQEPSTTVVISEQSEARAVDAESPRIEWGLVIHGGAGTITRANMTPEREAEYRAKMEEALRAGHAVLERGGSSLDAVVATINLMEDSPLFNAGRGAVFTAEETNSLDASIMDGASLRAGAVAGVMRVKNPITLARAVMEESPHVMLSGAGAEEFATLQGIELVDPSYFYVESRFRALQRVKERERQQAADTSALLDVARNDDKFGTVGAVALDRQGRIAAGTSTGGTTNKRWGRIGDSPIIGAGTYASDDCGVSATGWGEYFIRNVVAYDICARADYQDITLRESARRMIMEQLEAQEPETGGIIALDAQGHVIMMLNTPGMYRGWIGADGAPNTEIYR